MRQDTVSHSAGVTHGPYGTDVATQEPGFLYADALRAQQAHMAALGNDPERYTKWAEQETLRLREAHAKLGGDSAEKLTAEAWAVRMMLNQHGLEIRLRKTQRELETVLGEILKKSKKK